jgi:putative FmdB family regulatory protein
MIPATLPTYDYQCRSCGRTIEVIHPMREDGPSTCEVCGGELRRILHPAGIIFRGSGFYKTDSRSSSSASVPSGSKTKTTSDGTGSPEKGSGKSSDKGASGRQADSKPASPPPTTD